MIWRRVLVALFVVLLAVVAACAVEAHGLAQPLCDRRYWIGRFRDEHTELLRIMDATHATLKRHEITYWLHGGTLLGAVRHAAFVDWDDDMDIAILVEGRDFSGRWSAFAADMTRQGFSVNTRDDMFVSAAQIAGERYGSLHHVDALFYTAASGKFRPNWLLRTFAPQEYFAEGEVWPLREYDFAGRKYVGPREAWPFLARAYPGFDRAGRLHWPHSWSPAQIPQLSMCGLIASAFVVPDYPLTRIENERLAACRPPSHQGHAHTTSQPKILADLVCATPIRAL
jgi:hypothetical protein